MPAPALAARGHCPGPGAPPPTRDDGAARGQVPARGRARARWPRQTRPGEAARAHAGVDVPQYRAGAVASLRRSVAALAAAIVRAPTGAAAPHPRRRPARGRPGTRSTESPPPGCDHVRRCIPGSDGHGRRGADEARATGDAVRCADVRGWGAFWWDAVARPDGEGVDRGLRDHALRALAGKDGQVREWAAAHRLRLAAVPEWALVASEQELHAATRHPGITLASHTWTHPNLVQLPPAELEDELRRPLAWLRQRFERVIPWLSYPYGLASRAVEAAAAAAGYTAALVLEGGWCAPGRVRR